MQSFVVYAEIEAEVQQIGDDMTETLTDEIIREAGTGEKGNRLPCSCGEIARYKGMHFAISLLCTVGFLFCVLTTIVLGATQASALSMIDLALAKTDAAVVFRPISPDCAATCPLPWQRRSWKRYVG